MWQSWHTCTCIINDWWPWVTMMSRVGGMGRTCFSPLHPPCIILNSIQSPRGLSHSWIVHQKMPAPSTCSYVCSLIWVSGNKPTLMASVCFLYNYIYTHVYIYVVHPFDLITFGLPEDRELQLANDLDLTIMSCLQKRASGRARWLLVITRPRLQYCNSHFRVDKGKRFGCWFSQSYYW